MQLMLKSGMVCKRLENAGCVRYSIDKPSASNFDQVLTLFLIEPAAIVARRDHAMYPSFSFAFVSRLIRLRHLLSRIAVTVIVASGQIVSVSGDESADAQFENHIRPVLVETCFRCHGDSKVSGMLRVDSREALLKGGESGAAIVPGKPDETVVCECPILLVK